MSNFMGLYLSILHELGLKALKETLEKRECLQISLSGLVKMVKFVFQNNYFEFNGETKKQTSGTIIDTYVAPPIFMDQFELKFLKTHIHQLLVWFRYIDEIFFIWTHRQDKLEQSLVDFNKFHPTLKSTHEFIVVFLDFDVKFMEQWPSG